MDYLLPEHMGIPQATSLLGDRLQLRGGRPVRRSRVYFDTFDGRLHRSGMVAFHERGDMVLARSGDEWVRARAAMRRPGRRLLAADLEPGPLHDALERLIGVRALLPVARIDSLEQPLDVLDGESKTVVRLCIQQPEGLHPRLRLSAVRGYDGRLRGLQRTVERELGFHSARPLLEEAVIAAGGVPGGIRGKAHIELSARQRADAAAAAVLTAQARVIQANLDGAMADLDPEFLHEHRVAVRRSRAVLRELRGVFPPAERAVFQEELRWLQRATGELRDMDVWLLEFERMRLLVPEGQRPDLDPVAELLTKRRARALRATRRQLGSERTAGLLRDWLEFLLGLERSPADDRPAAARPVRLVAGARIAKLYGRMVRAGGALDETSPADGYHELRKQGKELRYMLELFGLPLYPSGVVTPLIKTLKELQDVLGRHQDRQVQVETLRALAPGLGRAERGTAAVMALGVLVQSLEDDQRAARAAFAERYRAFSADAQARAVKGAFG